MYRKGAERALGVWVGWGGVGRGALGSAWSFIHSRSPVLRVLVFPFKNYSRKNNNKNAQCVQFMFIHGVSGESGGVCMKPTGSNFDVHEKSTIFEYSTCACGRHAVRMRLPSPRQKKSVHSPNLVRSFTKYFVKDLDPDL